MRESYMYRAIPLMDATTMYMYVHVCIVHILILHLLWSLLMLCLSTRLIAGHSSHPVKYHIAHLSAHTKGYSTKRHKF